VAHRHAHQVRGHGRRDGEAVQRAGAFGLARHARHVGHDVVGGRRAHADVERGAERGLVEAGEQRARVDGLELRRQHEVAPARAVRRAVQAVAVAVHGAAIVDLDPVRARRDELAVGGLEQPRLRRGLGRDRQRARVERGVRGLQLLRMQLDGLHGRAHIHDNGDMPVEIVACRIQVQRELVARGHDLLGQAARRGVELKARLRRRRDGRAGKQRAGHDATNPVHRHGVSPCGNVKTRLVTASGPNCNLSRPLPPPARRVPMPSVGRNFLSLNRSSAAETAIIRSHRNAPP
jgi:hypothetical protein